MTTVLLQDHTIGAIDFTAEVGDTVTVSLQDENGLPLDVTGVIEEILD